MWNYNSMYASQQYQPTFAPMQSWPGITSVQPWSVDPPMQQVIGRAERYTERLPRVTQLQNQPRPRMRRMVIRNGVPRFIRESDSDIDSERDNSPPPRSPVFTRKSIYKISEQVEDSHIAKQVNDIILNMDDEIDISGYQLCTELRTETAIGQKELVHLITHILDNEIIAKHNIKEVRFKDFFKRVWQRIQKHESRDVLVSILNTELGASIGFCRNGLRSRILNVLSGFYDDVAITIKGPDQIAGIIEATREKIKPYCAKKHREVVKKELEERDFDKKIIEEWLKYIED